MTIPTARPKARPGKSAGIPKPDLTRKRYPGFVLENREIGRANSKPKRITLSQPPHYGRIGAQPEHAKPCPITAAATAAVKGAQFARQAKTVKHGARAVVR